MEPARGQLVVSRRTDAHYQLDVNYTQTFQLSDRYAIQVFGDLYNVFDKQTGYNVQPVRTSTQFGVPRNYYEPRRFQLSARFVF